MGLAPRVQDLRPCWLLRFVTGEARYKAFPQDPASGHAFGHAW